jgi:hypothetical protein
MSFWIIVRWERWDRYHLDWRQQRRVWERRSDSRESGSGMGKLSPILSSSIFFTFPQHLRFYS